MLLELVRSLREELTAAGRGPRPRAAMDRDPGWDALAQREAGRLPVREILGKGEFDVAALPAPEAGKTGEILSAAALGVTLADHAVAETGTVVQVSRPWRPRSISLLPPVHLAILPEDRILPDLGELLAARERESPGGGAYFTLITGPSRTADIEKVLTIGVHGPGRLVVAIVDGS